MSDVLAGILEHKRGEIAALRARTSERALRDAAAAQPPPRGFAAALRAQSGPAVIAEIKRASPSKGLIRPPHETQFDAARFAAQYAAGGAGCLSVLTDERFFRGHAGYLGAARGACALPALRKDFMLEPLQIVESRALGADCILLIAAALSPAQVQELAALADELGMDVLLEVHERAELEAVRGLRYARAPLLGINNRSLRTFETKLSTTLDLLPEVPAGWEVVTESGIASGADIRKMRDAGVQRFLIGESLMREEDPGAALRRLLAAAA